MLQLRIRILPDALRQEIQNFVNEHDLMQASRCGIWKRRNIGVSREMDALDDGIRQQEEERRVVENQLADWLRHFNVPDPEAYRTLRNEYQDTCHSLQEATREIQDKCDRVGLGTAEIRDLLWLKRSTNSPETSRLKNWLQKTVQPCQTHSESSRKSQKELVERMGALQKEVGQEQGKAIAALGRIPDEMAAVRWRIGGLDAEIGRLTVKKPPRQRCGDLTGRSRRVSEMMFSSCSARKSGNDSAT